jgi:hypothetical protein
VDAGPHDCHGGLGLCPGELGAAGPVLVFGRISTGPPRPAASVSGPSRRE